MAASNTCWTSGLPLDYPPLPRGAASADVVVIGGGLMGTAITYWLARQGCDVVLLESSHLAAGSTGRNAGLMLHGVSEIEDPRLVREVQELEGLDLEYTVPGHLSLASSQAVWEAFQSEVTRRPASAPPLRALERIDCEELLHLRIDSRYPGGRWYPGGAVVHPARFTCELARAAAGRGARIHTGTPATRIDPSGAAIVVRTGTGTLTTAHVVHATAASSRLLPELAGFIRPVRVQVMATDPLAPLFSVGLGVNWGDVFGRQLSDGRFVLGGGGGTPAGEHPDDADRIDSDAQARLRGFLPRTFPEFPAFTVRHMWTGVLDCTPDGKPLVGAHPSQRGHWLCAGFNGHGMPAALGVGRALARAIETGATPSSPQAWAPARLEVPAHAAARHS